MAAVGALGIVRPASFAERLEDAFALGEDAVAVEFGAASTTWRDLAAAADDLEARLKAAGVPRDATVGWVARNALSSIAVVGGLLRHGRRVAVLRPDDTGVRLSQAVRIVKQRPNETASRLADVVRARRFGAVVAEAVDWDFSLIDAVFDVCALGLFAAGALSTRPVDGLRYRQSPMAGPAGPAGLAGPGAVVEWPAGATRSRAPIATSEDELVAALAEMPPRRIPGGDERLRVKASPAFLLAPFSEAGGLFDLLRALYHARPMVLFETFEPQSWAEAVARHRPRSATLPPAGVAMILDAGIPPDALSSLRMVRTAASVDPRTQERFERRFGAKVVVDVFPPAGCVLEAEAAASVGLGGRRGRA